MRPPRLCMRKAAQSTPARRLTGAHRCAGRRRVAPAGPTVSHVHCIGMGEAVFYWQPLRSTAMRDPGCGKDEKWTMMVSAPGYTMAAGTE